MPHLLNGYIGIYSVQSWLCFCNSILDSEYSKFWCKVKWSSRVILMQKTNKQIKTKKQVTSYNILYTVVTTSRALGNNKSKLKQTWGSAYRFEMSMWNDYLFRLPWYEYVLCQALIKAIPRETDAFKYVSLLINSCLVCWLCSFVSLLNNNKR